MRELHFYGDGPYLGYVAVILVRNLAGPIPAAAGNRLDGDCDDRTGGLDPSSSPRPCEVVPSGGRVFGVTDLTADGNHNNRVTAPSHGATSLQGVSPTCYQPTQGDRPLEFLASDSSACLVCAEQLR